MTTDPTLESLFHASEKSYDDEDFAVKVMKKSRFVRYRNPILIGLSVIVTAILITILSNDVQSFILVLNNILTTDIVDLGEGMISVFLDPINTIAGILFIVAKIIHILYKWHNK